MNFKATLGALALVFPLAATAQMPDYPLPFRTECQRDSEHVAFYGKAFLEDSSTGGLVYKGRMELWLEPDDYESLFGSLEGEMMGLIGPDGYAHAAIAGYVVEKKTGEDEIFIRVQKQDLDAILDRAMQGWQCQTDVMRIAPIEQGPSLRVE